MKKIILAIVLLGLSIANFSHASTESYLNQTTSNLASTTVLNVIDDKFYDMQSNANWTSLFTHASVQNYVRLKIKPNVTVFTAVSACTVVVNVTYKYWDGPSASFLTSAPIQRTLVVNYNPNTNTTNDDISTVAFSGGHQVSVSVASISYTGFTSSTISNIYLESEIAVERRYVLASTAPQGLLISPMPVSSPKFIDFSWQHVAGAEKYELEFVHINDYGFSPGTYLPTSALNYDFYKNSTRVEVLGNSYRIPKIFDHGYLICRVRAIGLQGSAMDKRKEGPWDVVESGVISSIPIDHVLAITEEYDASMNWSYQAVYGEEGKRFDGISFFDGLGRSRQSVSTNPVNNQVIVSNVYYDDLGRPAVSDLPTPVSGESMRHFLKFNLSVTDNVSAYGKEFFNSTASVCPPTSAGFSTLSGAGKYYSPSNSDQTEENAFIPNAENFPFSRVVYKDDFSGRVSQVSSPGATLSQGQGHESRMYYPSAIQQELSRLFGSEVGKKGHYQKLMTVDANGQAMTQYVDMAGRVIASYLEGNTPAGVDAIEGNQSTPQTTAILVNGSDQIIEISETENYAEFTNNFVVSSDNTEYIFDYSFTPSQYTSACLPQTICLDCVYDFTIKITDDCGIIVGSKTQQINGALLDQQCLAPEIIKPIDQYPIVLHAGEYHISKKLAVNMEASGKYWCMFIDNNTCIEPLSETFNGLYESQSFASCSNEDYELPNDASVCDLARSLMLQDLSPGGQYAQYTLTYDANGNTVYSSTSPISVLNTSNTNLVGKYNNTNIVFRDQNGNVISVPTPSGPSSVNNLTLTEYVNAFQPQWAESLLPLHPEYCYLEFCNNNPASRYDNDLMNTTTLGQACILGFLTPLTGAPILGNCNSTNPDAFFSTTGGGSAYSSDMLNAMDSYITINDGTNSITLSMMKYAIHQAVCPSATLVTDIQDCITSFINNDFNSRECYGDLAWLNFRELYLQKKRYFFILAQQNESTNCSIEIGCVGNTAPACSSSLYRQSESRFGMALFNEFNSMSTAQIQTNITANADVACDQLSQNYANEWMTQLVGCGFTTQLTPSQLTALKNEFAELCALGCDLEHPFGATTAPSGMATSNGNSTINDVISFHLQEASIIFSESDICSELLINSPKPYQTTPVQMQANVSPLDQCGCEAVLTASDQYNTQGTPALFASPEEVFANNTGIILPDINALICICKSVVNTAPNATTYWLPNADQILAQSGILIPNDLACESSSESDECKNCVEITAKRDDLLERFDNISNFTQTNNYPRILTNFLNNSFNFTLQYADYQHFIEGCEASSANPNCSVLPIAYKWTEMLGLIAIRGQLLTPLATPLNLAAENIVYQQTESLQQTFNQHTFHSVEQTNSLELKFGITGQPNCSFSITRPNPTFDFSKIIYFSNLTPSTETCGANNQFSIRASYIECGTIKEITLEATSSCMPFVQCACGDNQQVLCNKPITLDTPPCYQPDLNTLIAAAREIYLENVNDAYTDFRNDFNAKCREAFQTENMSYSGQYNAYQFTLFYYDQAGNLIKTVAPKGINPLSAVDADAAADGTDDVTSQSTTVPAIKPVHTFTTTYKYNSYNQVVETTNPDQQGASIFFYDRYGRLVASQNPKQATLDQYAYVLYDKLGRPYEAGIVVRTIPPSQTVLFADDLGASFRSVWLVPGIRSEVTRTTYDYLLSGVIGSKFQTGVPQIQNTRLRVTTVAYYESFSATTNPLAYTSAIHYSYDIHGNVIEQLQDVPMLAPVEQDVKSTTYEFQLISGNVKKVNYQKNKADQFTHSYKYDAANRLTHVYTSHDNEVHQTLQAHYFYYDYGPLARVEIGKEKVQGMDYAYTINGWIKGMNSSRQLKGNDIGKDGNLTGYNPSNNTIHRNVALDVLAYNVGYFKDDYKPITTAPLASAFEMARYNTTGTPYLFETTAGNLYNGNISSTVISIDGTNNTLGTAYKYDQLQRLKKSTTFEITSASANDWSVVNFTDRFSTSYSYDKNGNFDNLTRKNNGTAMDNFSYTYLNIGSALSNRLGHVSDAVNASVNTDDIESQNPNNYSYDELGQLISDQQEMIASIEWRSGDKKIKTLTRTSNSGNKSDMEFVYNPMGQRILKIEKPRVNNVLQTRNWWKYTYYTYDANGQVMATYEVTLSTALNRAYLKDQNIYGASRIGMRQKYIALYENATVPYTIPAVQQNTLGTIAYEITNYLGNVNVVISDRKIWTPPTNAFKACMVSRTDYFPFGMEISSRTAVGSYRYGYNGMEQDSEAKGEGNSYTTEFRQYDPRIGRWLSLDPLMAQFPWQSPYCAFDNNPVFFTDPLGLKSQDNIHIWEDGAMSIEKTDDPTNTYYFHHCDGTTVTLGDQLLKTNTGMVEMPQNTDFYKQVAYKDRKYLPSDAAAGFLAATYMFSKDNSRKVKINQFMTSDWTHSSHPSKKACVDVQYIGDDKTPLDVQPQSNHHNVNVMKSNELANRYREFGFNTDGPWSVISLDGDFTGPLLDNSAAAAEHHHHFHIQGWAPPDGSFKPIIGKVNSQLIKSSTLKPLIETVSQSMTNAEETTYIFNRIQQVGLDGLNCWEWARGAMLGIWDRMGVDTGKSSGCGKNQ